MAKTRPVFHPELGKFFETLRLGRGLKSRRLAAAVADRKGIPLDHQVIFKLEHGKLKNPEPHVLRAVAALYEVPYAELVSQVVEQLYGVKPERTDSPTPIVAIQAARGTFAAPEPPDFRYVALMKDRIAAGQPLVIADDNVGGALAFSSKSLKKWRRPICVRVGRNEESMLPIINPNDVVLLECADDERREIRPGAIYAVRHENGATLKRVERVQQDGRGWLLLIAENADKTRYPTIPVPIVEGQTLHDFIIGRVVWHGQYL